MSHCSFIATDTISIQLCRGFFFYLFIYLFIFCLQYLESGYFYSFWWHFFHKPYNFQPCLRSRSVIVVKGAEMYFLTALQ